MRTFQKGESRKQLLCPSSCRKCLPPNIIITEKLKCFKKREIFKVVKIIQGNKKKLLSKGAFFIDLRPKMRPSLAPSPMTS